MKVLFVGPKSPDHLGSVLWDGLQEVLGQGNVVDAVDSPWLHASSMLRLCEEQAQGERQFDFPMILQSIGASREGEILHPSERPNFDVAVVMASVNRDGGWDRVREYLSWLRPGGKVAYLESWDAAWQIEPPGVRVDAVFRKEISPSVPYPYYPHHLTFAAPSRWFKVYGPRPYDVAFVGNPNSIHPSHAELRWRMLSETFRTFRHHSSVLATRGLGYDAYFRLMRSAKLALCPTAADSSDSLRTYEAAACGAVPVFVGYPPYRREPWFGGDCSISCSVETLAEHLDNALSHDLGPMRERLRQHAMDSHTTRARALKLLGVLGFHEGADF